MQQIATWNSSAAAGLPALLEAFGCVDVVAPVDVAAFGKRASDLTRQGARAQRIRHEEEESTAGLLLTVLQNAPPLDRHSMIAAVSASALLLVTAGALVLLG